MKARDREATSTGTLDAKRVQALLEGFDADDTLNHPEALTDSARLSVMDSLASGDTFALDPGSVSGVMERLPELALGTTSSEFEVISELGSGGMGDVLLARQHTLDREVAVKQLRAEQRGQRASIEALLYEARLTGGLEHPGIPPVHTIGVGEDGAPVMIMKRVEGVDWQTLIDDPTHPAWTQHDGEPLERHVEILMQIAQTLEFAHARGIVHLDIKPENVMLGDYGEVYVMDWGVAMRLDQREAMSERVVGTPACMPPEMLEGAQNATPRTDVFLLGATLYQILTGEPLYAGSVMEALLAAQKCPEPRFDPDTPELFTDIVRRACAKRPDDRYESARDFREALASSLKHRGSLQLAERARASLERLEVELERDDDAAERSHTIAIYKAFSESRFGFEQALREWPGNTRAEAGLQRCLERMFAYELEQDNVTPAEALLEALPEPRPELEARLEETRRALAEEESARQTLAELQREQSFRSKSWYRSAFAILHGLLWCALLLTVDIQLASGAWSITPGQNALIGVVVWVQVLGLFLLLRKRLFDNTVRRQLMLAVMVYITAFLLNRSMAWSMDWSFIHAMQVDLLALFLFAGCIAALSSPPFWIAAAVMAAFVLISAASPQLTLELHALVALLLNLLAAWVLRPMRAPPATGEPAP